MCFTTDSLFNGLFPPIPLPKSNMENRTRMLKRSMGAFWGAVFKGALGYQTSQTVTVSLKDPLPVSTASYFVLTAEG